MTREYWLVTSDKSMNMPNIFRTREWAQAKANLDNIEYDYLGPWYVVHVREVAPVVVGMEKAA